jgi:hypothetical protein
LRTEGAAQYPAAGGAGDGLVPGFAVGDTFDEKVAGVVKKLGVPSREEITNLTQRVEELTTKVDQLKAGTKKSK